MFVFPLFLIVFFALGWLYTHRPAARRRMRRLYIRLLRNSRRLRFAILLVGLRTWRRVRRFAIRVFWAYLAYLTVLSFVIALERPGWVILVCALGMLFLLPLVWTLRSILLQLSTKLQALLQSTATWIHSTIPPNLPRPWFLDTDQIKSDWGKALAKSLGNLLYDAENAIYLPLSWPVTQAAKLVARAGDAAGALAELSASVARHAAALGIYLGLVAAAAVVDLVFGFHLIRWQVMGAVTVILILGYFSRLLDGGAKTAASVAIAVFAVILGWSVITTDFPLISAHFANAGRDADTVLNDSKNRGEHGGWAYYQTTQNTAYRACRACAFDDAGNLTQGSVGTYVRDGIKKDTKVVSVTRKPAVLWYGKRAYVGVNPPYDNDDPATEFNESVIWLVPRSAVSEAHFDVPGQETSWRDPFRKLFSGSAWYVPVIYLLGVLLVGGWLLAMSKNRWWRMLIRALMLLAAIPLVVAVLEMNSGADKSGMPPLLSYYPTWFWIAVLLVVGFVVYLFARPKSGGEGGEVEKMSPWLAILFGSLLLACLLGLAQMSLPGGWRYPNVAYGAGLNQNSTALVPQTAIAVTPEQYREYLGLVDFWQGRHPAVSRNKILAVIQHESHWNPLAKNPNSTAAGLMQLVAATQQR